MIDNIFGQRSEFTLLHSISVRSNNGGESTKIWVSIVWNFTKDYLKVVTMFLCEPLFEELALKYFVLILDLAYHFCLVRYNLVQTKHCEGFILCNSMYETW